MNHERNELRPTEAGVTDRVEGPVVVRAGHVSSRTRCPPNSMPYGHWTTGHGVELMMAPPTRCWTGPSMDARRPGRTRPLGGPRDGEKEAWEATRCRLPLCRLVAEPRTDRYPASPSPRRHRQPSGALRSTAAARPAPRRGWAVVLGWDRPKRTQYAIRRTWSHAVRQDEGRRVASALAARRKSRHGARGDCGRPTQASRWLRWGACFPRKAGQPN